MMPSSSSAAASLSLAMRTETPTAMSNALFTDTVNRVVLRVACTEGHEESSPARQTPLSHAGPLTPRELSELSLLCTSANAARSNNNTSEDTPSGFATVEGDQLLALLELLDRHIDSAVSVNFIPEALELLQKEESPSKASASLDKVRRFTLMYLSILQMT